MSFHFEPVWSWTLTLIACVAMLAVLWLGYPRRIRHLSAGWRRILIALRLAIVVVLCLLLLRPFVEFESHDDSDSILYVLTDASRSMQTEDIPGGGTRRQALLKILAAAEPGLKAIGEKAEIRFRDFPNALQTVPKPEDKSDGAMTANRRLTVRRNSQRSRASSIVSGGWSSGRIGFTGC